MAFYLGSVELPTQKKQQMVDITARVRAEVKSSGVQNGLCTVFAPHTTGAITINENTDPDVQTDILNALERAVPQKGKYYKHEEGNAPAHAKAALIGASETVPVQGGKLLLGTWQAIYLWEHRRAPHRRQLIVTVVGV